MQQERIPVPPAAKSFNDFHCLKKGQHWIQLSSAASQLFTNVLDVHSQVLTLMPAQHTFQYVCQCLLQCRFVMHCKLAWLSFLHISLSAVKLTLAHNVISAMTLIIHFPDYDLQISNHDTSFSD
jgi:hypothetical protein